MSANGKALVLITGANQGIGYHVASQLSTTGKHHVLVGSRSIEKANAAVKALQENDANSSASALEIDITKDNTIYAAAEKVRNDFGGKLEILINNAAISRMTHEGEDDPLREEYRALFETNVFGTAVVTKTFLPLIKASTYHDRRIVNVSSGLGLIGLAGMSFFPFNAKARPNPIYRSTKASLNMLTIVDSMVLRSEGITVVAAAPGYTKTQFTGYLGEKQPAESAKPIVRAAIEGQPLDLAGAYISDEGERALAW